MKTLTIVLAVSVCLSLAGVAMATSYDDNVNGNWSAPGTWLPTSGPPTTGDTVTIDNRNVKLDVELGTLGVPTQIDITGSGILDVQVAQAGAVKPVINVQSSGRLQIDAGGSANAVNLDVEMYGGRLYGGTDDGSGGEPATRAFLDGTVTLHNDSQINTRADWDGGLTLGGLVQGSGKLTVWAQSSEGYARLANANNTYSGGTDVMQGRLVVEADQALGTGTVNINTSVNRTWHDQWAVLEIGAAQSYGPGTQPEININKNSMLMASASNNLDVNITDGFIRTHNYVGADLSGQLTIAGEANIGVGTAWADVTVSGKITGSGKVVVDLTQNSRVRLNNPANDYTGGTDVRGMSLLTGADGCLGSGALNIGEGYQAEIMYAGMFYDSRIYRRGGRVLTKANGSLNGASEVNVNANGALEIKSTETRLVNIKTGGALLKTGGSTVFDYDPASGTQNFNLEPGAILCTTLGASVPSYTVVSGLTGGDGRFGVYLSRWDTVSANYDFGDDGSNIYRGLATINNHQLGGADELNRRSNLTYTGIATDVGGTDGLEFYAQTASTLTLNGAGGAQLNTSDGVVVDGGGTIKFNGTVGGTFSTVDKYGSGVMVMDAAAGLSGKTVTIREGFLDFNNAASPDGATIVIDPVGTTIATGVRLDQNIGATTGTIEVRDGGYVDIRSENGVNAANSSVITFQSGSRIILNDASLNTAPALDANGIDVAVVYHWQGMRLPGDDLQVGDGSLLVPARNAFGETQSLEINNFGTGITLSPSATTPEAGFAAPTGKKLTIWSPVNLGAGSTLVIGYKGMYDLIHQGDIIAGSTPTEMNGVVEIRNDADPMINRFDTVRVESGVVRFLTDYNGPSVPKTSTRMGDCEEVILKNGGEVGVDAWNNVTKAMVVRGNGVFDVGYYDWGTWRGGQRDLHLQPTASVAAGLAPGLSVGKIEVKARNLWLDAGAGGEMVQVSIDLPNGTGVPGVDFDAVTCSGPIILGTDAAELVLNLPVPSVNFKPASVNATFLSATNNLVGTFTSVVASPSMPAAVASHYDLSGVVDYGYTMASVVLTGTTWTAHMGDATLDDAVDVYDLSALANNYQVVAPQDWTTADYDLSGVVDVYDLADLANNYGWTAGGDPVPEPASLGLIVLGACLPLLRRRRR